MEGRSREVLSRLAVVWAMSGGVKSPFSRKGFMFDMRRREEAEGERRMMGSSLRPGALGLERLETRAELLEGVGREEEEDDLERPR
jgi:hypothetical protein